MHINAVVQSGGSKDNGPREQSVGNEVPLADAEAEGPAVMSVVQDSIAGKRQGCRWAGRGIVYCGTARVTATVSWS